MHKYFEQEMDKVFREFTGLGGRHYDDDGFNHDSALPRLDEKSSDRQLMLKDDDDGMYASQLIWINLFST